MSRLGWLVGWLVHFLGVHRYPKRVLDERWAVVVISWGGKKYEISN